MDTATQLTVSLRNIPGSLAKLSDTLRAADVNISAISGNEINGTCAVHVIVDDPDTAKMALNGQYKVATEEVLAFKMKNQPGAIASIARSCAAAGINIRNMYATTFGREATVYVSVDDIQKAVSLLKSWKKSFGTISA